MIGKKRADHECFTQPFFGRGATFGDMGSVELECYEGFVYLWLCDAVYLAV